MRTGDGEPRPAGRKRLQVGRRPGFEAPGVVVSYTKDPDIQTGRKFLAEGMQIAAGVPLMCDEPADFRTFRVGLFGLDKLADVDGTVAQLEAVLGKVAEG